MRRALLPWGSGRNFATSGTGLLMTGSGCITYADAYETTGSAPASVTVFDGQSSNGQQLIDYQLLANQSTSEQWGPHWMPFYEGLYIVTNNGSAAGSISAWADQDCAYHLNIQFMAQEGAITQQGVELAPLFMGH